MASPKTYPLTWMLLVVLVCVVVGVVTGFITPWDRAFTLALQSFHPHWWNTFMISVSWPGYPPQTFIVFIGGILALFLSGWKKEAGWLAVGLAGVVVTGYAFKFGIDRPRPAGEGIVVVNRGLEGGRFSFPAGHVQATTFFLLFIAWCMYLRCEHKDWKMWGKIFLISLPVLLMGMSRVYMGEHWMSDVVGGYLVGGIWTTLAIRQYERSMLK